MLYTQVLVQAQPQIGHSLYARARERGRRGQLWSTLTGRSRSLLSLKSIETDCAVRGCCSAGQQTVSIEQICGSGHPHEDSDGQQLVDNQPDRRSQGDPRQTQQIGHGVNQRTHGATWCHSLGKS